MGKVIDTDDETAVFAGIDWGGSFHQLCVVDADGQVTVRRKIDHDTAGLAELAVVPGQVPGRLRVAIERGEGLLVEFLQGEGLQVFCVSPKISARARERYRLAATKSDAFARSCWPTRCATNTRTGGHWPWRHRCCPRSGRSAGTGNG